MAISLHCDLCQNDFLVRDTLPGQRVRCPRCQAGTIPVPALRRVRATAVVDDPAAPATPDHWHLKTTESQVYGPVQKSELDQWAAEGRISPHSQILPPGADQWQWASGFYPQLRGARPAAVSAVPVARPLRPANAPAGAGRRSKVVAGVLGILLGGLGIHRFYLGFIGIGFAQIAVSIVTCGFGSIWGLIEGILILTDQIDRDAEGNPLAE